MANLLVVYDAYYATDWKKLVSPRSPSIWSGEEVAPELMQRLMSGEELTVEELMKLSGATDELSGLSTTLEKIIEDFGVPLSWEDEDDFGKFLADIQNKESFRKAVQNKLSSAEPAACFAMTGEVYRAVESAGDPNQILKYFRPLILSWNDQDPEANLFNNTVQYKTNFISGNLIQDPYYKLNFKLVAINSAEAGKNSMSEDDAWFAKKFPTKENTPIDPEFIFGNLPNPLFFNSIDSRSSLNTPIPILEIPELTDISWLSTPGNNFQIICQKVTDIQVKNLEAMQDSKEVDADIVYAPIKYLINLPLQELEYISNLEVLEKHNIFTDDESGFTEQKIPQNMEQYLTSQWAGKDPNMVIKNTQSIWVSLSGVRGPVNYVLGLEILGKFLAAGFTDPVEISESSQIDSENVPVSWPANKTSDWDWESQQVFRYLNDNFNPEGKEPGLANRSFKDYVKLVHSAEAGDEQSITKIQDIISDISEILAILQSEPKNQDLVSLDVYDY